MVLSKTSDGEPACVRKHTTTRPAATVQAARRGGGGGGRRPPPPRGPAGAPEPRERRQPTQRSALRRALRHRLRKNQPAQAYHSQPWRRQSRRAHGGRGGGRGACARSGPRGRAAVGVTGKSMRASAAASLGGLSRLECTRTAAGVGWEPAAIVTTMREHVVEELDGVGGGAEAGRVAPDWPRRACSGAVAGLQRGHGVSCGQWSRSRRRCSAAQGGRGGKRGACARPGPGRWAAAAGTPPP